MLTFSKENRQKAGFTLIEALVALSLAAVFLPVIIRGFANAWTNLTIGADTENSMTIARALAAQWRDSDDTPPPTGSFNGFHYQITSGTLGLEQRDAQLPPALPAPNQKSSDKSPGGQDASPQGQLLHIVILVTAPSGRTLRYETAKFQFEAR